MTDEMFQTMAATKAANAAGKPLVKWLTKLGSGVRSPLLDVWF